MPTRKNKKVTRSKRSLPHRVALHVIRLYGFTIIELLIVIIVIGIISTIVFVSYSGITKKAHDTGLTVDLVNNGKLLNIARSTNAYVKYPATQNDANLQATTGNTLLYNVSSDQTAFCLQASGFGSSYYITDTSQTPQIGVCNGATGVGSTGPVLASASFAPIGSGSAPSVSIPMPSGASNGSLIILHVFAEYQTTTAGSITSQLGVPSNFTLAYSINSNEYGNSFQELAAVYYGYVKPGDTSYTATFNKIGSVSPNDEWASAALITNGPTAGNPFKDAFQQFIQTPDVSNNFTLPTFTPGGNNSLVYVAVSDPGNIIETTYGTPAGWAKAAGGAGTGYYGADFYKNQATAAPIGPTTFTSDRGDGKYVITGVIR